MMSSILNNIKTTEYNYKLKDSNNCKIAIVASKFNSIIVDNLIKGCVESLMLHDIPQENIEIITVPGALELPLAAQNILKRSDISGVVALGAVIRGATPHFDYVAGECSSGLARLSLEYNKPIGFGVLTTDTIEQAIERAGCKAGNKGADAASAVVAMLGLLEKIGDAL